MRKYKKYHTDIKMTFALGVQKHFLPESFLKQIPNSTSYYWKEENSEKYLGVEFAKGIQKNLEDTKFFLDQRLYFSRMAFLQFARLYLTIISLIGKDDFKKLIKSNRNILVDLLENLTENFPITKKDLLRFLMISNYQYAFWLSDRTFACNQSLIGQCFKRRPKQTSNTEIINLKKYTNNPSFKRWCIRSIWGKQFGMVQFLWQSLLGTNTSENSDILKRENYQRYRRKEGHLMHLVPIRLGIWTFRNIKPWTM